jgi:hypothetical protein
MITIAGGIILGFLGLWTLGLTLNLMFLSFQSQEGRMFWAIMGACGTALLFLAFGGGAYLVAIIALVGGALFYRKHAQSGAAIRFPRYNQDWGRVNDARTQWYRERNLGKRIV